MEEKKELEAIRSELSGGSSSAIIIYGRRIGKTSLILEALKGYEGMKIVFTASPDEIRENVTVPPKQA